MCLGCAHACVCARLCCCSSRLFGWQAYVVKKALLSNRTCCCRQKKRCICEFPSESTTGQCAPSLMSDNVTSGEVAALPLAHGAPSSGIALIEENVTADVDPSAASLRDEGRSMLDAAPGRFVMVSAQKCCASCSVCVVTCARACFGRSSRRCTSRIQRGAARYC